MKSREFLLDFPSLYLLSQGLLGAKKARKRCIEEYAHPKPGMRVLDLGCGPGYVIEYLPGVCYHGFDTNARYIDYARRKYGAIGTFCCRNFDAAVSRQLGSFDLVLMMGLLHHLNDQQALELLYLSKEVLKSTGSLITLDPCHDPKGTFVSRFLLNRDRGESIREEADYTRLASKPFITVHSQVRVDLFSLPYTALVMVCKPIQ